MPDVTNGIFSDYCYNKMWDLFKNHKNEVGSDFPGDKRSKSITNCVIYVMKVLIYGHEQLGIPQTIKDIKEMYPRQDGIELAKYLVNKIGWNAHYWNPDVWNPRDKDSEHIVSYKNVLRTKLYYGIPIGGLIVGYNKQDKTPKKETVWIPTIPTPLGTIPLPTTITTPADHLEVFEKLKRVKFGIGVNRGGMHCFLLSYGDVFEVHYNYGDEVRLYGKQPLYGYGWNSGCILTPPDSSFTSNEVKG